MLAIKNTLTNIQETVTRNLPYYSDFKKTDASEYKVSTNELTDTQKKDIEALIETNNHLFGYTKDASPILTYIIKYSTSCTNVVEIVDKLNVVTRIPAKAFLAFIRKNPREIQNKLDNVINYFYYYPKVTEHIGYSLEKHVGVPQDLERDDFNMSYAQYSTIIYKKDGKKLNGIISEINKNKFKILNMKDGTHVELNEEDILGFYEMTGPGDGIISHLFTNQNISEIEKNCTTIGEKCDKNTSLAKRNSVICSLKNGARIVNKAGPEIKICTECIKDPKVMSNDSLRDTIYGKDKRESLYSVDSSESTLSREETNAYETFKTAVCASDLKIKSETHTGEIDEKDKEIQKLKQELNTQGLRVLPNFRRKKYKSTSGGKKKSSTKKSRKKKTHKKKTHKKKTRKYRK